jgi:transcriptional regulator with XRE-family HTH domain
MGAPSGIRHRIAVALRSRREELGLTQEAVAGGCGMSARYLRSLEAGTSAASVEALHRLLDALQWSWIEIGERLSEPAAKNSKVAPVALHRSLDLAWARQDAREGEILRKILAAFVRP